MKKTLLLVIICLCKLSISFAFVTQGNWRWRNDNGSQTSATWRAPQNTTITIGTIDTVIRLRIQLSNTTGELKGVNANVQYASAPDGPWRYLTAFAGNNAFMLAGTNAYVTDLAATTQQLNGASSPFVTGKVFVKTTTLNTAFANNIATEHEYVIKPTENITPGTTYYFRVPGLDYPVALPSLLTTANIKAKKKSVTNGSFENDLQNWTFSVLGSAAATAAVIDSVHQDGIKSMSVNVATAGGSSDIRLIHTAQPLVAGKTYMVRFWAKAKKRSAQMQLAVKGGRKTLLYNYKMYTGWEEFQFAFKAPASSVSLGFLFQTKTDYNIDHVEILDEENKGIDVAMNYMWQNKRPVDQYSMMSADGVYSEPLPDGRTAWTCSDGWYGYNDTTTNSMSTNRLLRNSLIVQSAPKPDGTVITKIAGTPAQPQSLMVPPNPIGHDDFFWPRDMIVDNDSLKILLPDTRQLKENDPVTYGNREAIGVFSLPDLTLRRIDWLPFIDSIQYGTLVKADDGYTYAYSKHDVNAFESRAIVARFPTGKLAATTPWQFLTDTGWSYDYHNSKEIAEVELYSVVRLGPNHYVAVFMTPASDKMEAIFAQSPLGPWVGRTVVGQVEGQADIFTYFGVIHEETGKDGEYTMSYSNIGDIGQMLDDKTVYWPTFIKANLKNLSPFKDVVLSVKLDEFTANAAGSKVLLNWKSVTETNNNRFEIERSADGTNNWVPVAAVKSKGNSLQRQSYNVYDATPLNGSNFYRLKQVSMDNQVTYSGTRLVKMNLLTTSLRVYPNPVKNGNITFELNNYSGGNVHMKLLNMNGVAIFSSNMNVQPNGIYRLPLTSKTAAGVYTLVAEGTGIHETIKVIVQ